MRTSIFRDPASARIETVSSPWLWALLFGCFYFAFKKAWLHATVSAALAVATAGLSWFIYPLFANRVVSRAYIKRGWTPLAEEDSACGTNDDARQAQRYESPSAVSPIKDLLYVLAGATVIALMMSGGGAPATRPSGHATAGALEFDIATLTLLATVLTLPLLGLLAFVYTLVQSGFRRRRVGVVARIASAFFLGGLLFGVISSFRSPEALEAAYRERHDAFVAGILCSHAEKAVREKLKSPSSAEFPGCSSYKIRSNEERTEVSVEGYVEASNSFGVLLRSPFFVQLSHAGDSSDWYGWSVTMVSVQ
jgi:hypothetical protein